MRMDSLINALECMKPNDGRLLTNEQHNLIIKETLTPSERDLLRKQIDSFTAKYSRPEPIEESRECQLFIIFNNGAVFDWNDFINPHTNNPPLHPPISNCAVIEKFMNGFTFNGKPAVWMYACESFFLHAMLRKYFGLIPNHFQPTEIDINAGLDLQTAYSNYCARHKSLFF